LSFAESRAISGALSRATKSGTGSAHEAGPGDAAPDRLEHLVAPFLGARRVRALGHEPRLGEAPVELAHDRPRAGELRAVREDDGRHGRRAEHGLLHDPVRAGDQLDAPVIHALERQRACDGGARVRRRE
jgi:hypothetical protein